MTAAIRARLGSDKVFQRSDTSCEQKLPTRALWVEHPQLGRRIFLRKIRFAAAAGVIALATVWSVAASATETITYTYDSRGRLIAVVRTSPLSNGVASSYNYDDADNRTNVTITGASTGSTSGGGPTPPGGVFIVVPLNGYTLIKVK